MSKKKIKRSINTFLLGALLAFSAVGINISLQYLFGWASSNFIDQEIQFSQLAYPLLSSLATGFFEEFIFRVLLLSLLLKIIKNNWLVILIGSLIFASLHAANSHITILALISHFFGGVIYSYAFIKTKAIWLPFGLHFGWNYTQILFGIPMSGSNYYSFMKTTFYSDDFFSGGLYGFEAGILSLVSRILILLIFYFGFEKRILLKNRPQTQDKKFKIQESNHL